jgi:amidohydrolase
VDEIAEACRTLEDQIIDWRREFHRHPELSYQETWTGRRIQAELDRLGLPWEAIPESTSFAATVEGARPGPAVALRADIDGLPVTEDTGLAFASETEGVMHACGHDGHIAMLLGAASVLAARRDQLAGRVHLLFQSAEEVGGGAVELIRWLMDHGGAERVAALHIWSSLPAGTLMLYPGATMSGLFAFKITFRGEGGHGSRPDLVRDPIKAACDVVLQLSAIPVNYYDALDHAVVHIGQIHAGTAPNIFPETAEVIGGVRYFNPAGPPELMDLIKRMLHGAELTHNVECRIDFSPVLTPVMNDAAALAEARQALAAVDGLELLDATQPLMGSDNYSLFTAEYPGFYGFLGAADDERGLNVQQHSPHFDLDEAVLVQGTEFLVRYALGVLGVRG